MYPVALIVPVTVTVSPGRAVDRRRRRVWIVMVNISYWRVAPSGMLAVRLIDHIIHNLTS